MAGGGAWGAIAQGVTDIASSALGQWQANKNAAKAWEHYKKRYQVTVRDMQKAGLNPILAAGNANVGGIPNAAQTLPGHVSDYAGAFQRGAANTANIENTKANTAYQAAAAYQSGSTARAADQDVQLKAMQGAEIAARLPGVADKQRAEITNLAAQAGANSARAANDIALKPQIEFGSGMGGAAGRVMNFMEHLLPSGSALATSLMRKPNVYNFRR